MSSARAEYVIVRFSSERMRMRLSVLLLVFCGFAVAAGHSNDIDSGGYGKRAYRINDDSDCQLRIYRVRGFQGKPYIIRSDRGRLRGLEKSVQTLGEDELMCFAPLD